MPSAANEVFLSVVCPFYNEQGMVELFMQNIIPVLEQQEKSYELICIDDGSGDATLSELLEAQQQYPAIRVLSLSRNFGKEAALTAGLDHAQGQVIVPIDADLQDPPELITQLIALWKEGYDVVLAKRTDRSTDSILKRLTARWFYKLHNKISNLNLPENVGDFRLISRKVLMAIQQLPENQRFMKGIFAWVGFKTASVEYKRARRAANKSSFNFVHLWNLALESITSFSSVPLRVWLYMGATISFLSFIYASVIIVRTLILGIQLPGYASLMVTILFLGGIQLMGIGVLGEYIGRIYLETKRRPSYLIDKEY